MKKILVLDAFTNGHDAALSFLNRRGWALSECEIVFCGTHTSIVEKLKEEAAYAVLPVYNSICHEVTDVTKLISDSEEKGYDFQEIERIDMQINHCLLAPQHIKHAGDLERILSHEKAIQQCGKYLSTIGIGSDKRNKRDSTGNAAKAVARMNSETKIGAIASKSAALEYNLRILAENIQDVPDNKTTFVLLENKAYVKPARIGIIGIKGRFGSLLKNFFESLGCTVTGCGRDIDKKIEVVRENDVVIFSVPIKDTPLVVDSVREHTREDQLLMDVTSFKQHAVEAMLGTKSQVLGLHPMFRPEVPFEGQTVVACPARLTLPHWKTWAVNMLSATKSKIKWSTPREHDNYMTTVQVVPHLANLTSALLITESGISVSESLDYTSPFYRIMFSLMGRLVSQNPDMYTSIVLENPETEKMLEQRIAIEKRLLEMIRSKDHKAFEQLFSEASKHFGSEVTKEANELFVRLLAVLSTLYGKNSVTLEFTKSQNRPGLLEKISRVFRQHQVNMTGINSVVLDGQRVQFTISFEQSRSSDSVFQALNEIEKWNEPKVKIVN